MIKNPASMWAQIRQFHDRSGFMLPNPSALVGNTWYADSANGSDGNSGLGPGSGYAFATIEKLLSKVDHGDIGVLFGVFREQLTGPVKYDITLIGASNRPRQATSGGVHTGGGASWLAPAAPVAVTPLIQVVAQGWKFVNIQMAPVAGAACIRFRRRETAAIPDASHGAVFGCYFSTGGAGGHGIDVTECKRILVEDCDFEALGTGTAILNTADGGVAQTGYGVIRGNRFQRGNAGDIIVAGNDYLIEGNRFYAVFGTEGGMRIDLDGGARNRVLNNHFADATAQYAIAGGYRKGAATDVWRNWVSDAVDPIVTLPA
jgi:hypothetical protein